MFGFLKRRFLKRRSTGSEPRDPGEAGTIYRFDRPVRRSWLACRWQAREAVSAKLPLRDYLQYRLRDYLAQAPQNRHPLPFEVSIEEGEIIQTPNPEADAHPWRGILEEPAGGDSFEASTVRAIRFLSHSESQAVLRDLQEYEGEFSKLSARIDQAKEDLEDQDAERQYEIAGAESPVPATLDRPRENRGRPLLSSPWIPWMGSLAIAIIICAEAWQFALPYLNTTGVDISALSAEWNRNPIAILAGSSFALVASALIFILWYWVFQSIVSCFRDSGPPEPRWRTILKAALPPALVVGLIAVAWGIGGLRHGVSQGAGSFLGSLHSQATTASGGEWVFILLTVLVPLATAFLQHKIGEIVAHRRQIVEEQKQWDLEEHRALLVPERRQELIRLLEEKRAYLEQAREEVRTRISALSDRGQQVEAMIRHQLGTARAFSWAFMRSLLAALEQDRYCFLLEAGRRGATELINGHPLGQARLQRESLPEPVASLHQTPAGGNGRRF